MPKVICISFARGSRFTVTTAIMATKKPKDVNTSDTGVLVHSKGDCDRYRASDGLSAGMVFSDILVRLTSA